jgi:hypothetical protein
MYATPTLFSRAASAWTVGPSALQVKIEGTVNMNNKRMVRELNERFKMSCFQAAFDGLSFAHRDAAIHSICYINAVTTTEIIAAIDAEIARLQQVRNLIAGVPPQKRRGRPAGSAATPAKAAKRRALSAAARKIAPS